MGKTQTAVEWFFDNLKNHEIQAEHFELYQQAKQMEKEQMHKCASFWRWKKNEIEKPIFQQYYNETYK